MQNLLFLNEFLSNVRLIIAFWNLWKPENLKYSVGDVEREYWTGMGLKQSHPQGKKNIPPQTACHAIQTIICNYHVLLIS